MTDGERWTREQLEALRREGYAPAAINRFLLASRRRAADQRAARPALARQAHRWIALGALAWAVGAATGRGPFRRRLGAGMVWWALTGLMLDWHLGMVETEDGRPRRLSAADACTLGRAWLVPVAADTPSPPVCLLALATDGLDGALARAGRPTRLGRDLEGVVDAAFAAAVVRGALRNGWLGRSAAAAECVRLAAGAAYTAAAYFGEARAPDPGVARAGRIATPVRAAGMVAAGLGRRRTGDALVWAAALASAGAAVRAATQPTRRAPAA